LFLRARERRTALSAVAAGAVLALATLTRPTVAPMIPLAAGWLMLPPGRGTSWRPGIRGGLLAFVAALAVLSPWLVRQHAVLGYWAFSGDFGRTLFVGNNPDTFAFYPKDSIDKSQALAGRHAWPEAQRAGLTPNIYDPRNGPWLRDRALRYIRANPGTFAVNMARKNIAAFGILPSPRHGLIENLSHALSYGPVLLLSLIGLWRERHRWRLYGLFYAQFLVFVAETALLWAHTSHRAFLDVYLIAFAAVALAPWAPRGLSARNAA
jgi:4-amino-4-deoxy-L-arabinose transferase-like glycosyltransferase